MNKIDYLDPDTKVTDNTDKAKVKLNKRGDKGLPKIGKLGKGANMVCFITKQKVE